MAGARPPRERELTHDSHDSDWSLMRKERSSSNEQLWEGASWSHRSHRVTNSLIPACYPSPSS